MIYPDHVFYHREGLDSVERHTSSVTVATCDNCFDRTPTGKKQRYERSVMPGNPAYCPDCNFALFYERIPKSKVKNG